MHNLSKHNRDGVENAGVVGGIGVEGGLFGVEKRQIA